MDRNAPISIVTAIVICVVGVFALMIMPIFSGIYELAPGYTGEQGGKVMIAEVAGGALASILAMFWITKFNWRTAVTFALLCVVVGNAMVAFQFTIIPVEYLRLLVFFFG
ncbi:MAG: hypothetical protein QGH46_09260 [Gammaproteobacteria bacterium]|jgi:hypothetical protein|nr:hypothetical protein [Gammaproteobacteria bacterium]